MARNICILTAVFALAVPVLADDLTPVKGIGYSNGKITGFEGGVVSIEVNGNVIRKNVEEIALLSVTSQGSFNDAEKALAAKKYAEAVQAYDQAIDRVSDIDWLKQLTAVRRLKALGQAGMIDRAVTEWMALAEQTSNAKYVIAMVPAKLAAKGSRENTDAIASLEAKEGALDKDSPILSGVRQLLLDLYQKEALADKAKALTAKMGGGGKPPEGQTTDNTTKPPTGKAGNLADILKAAEYSVSHGQAQQALTSLKGALQDYTPAELPKALLLMGKAQMELAKSAKDPKERRQYLVDAGLDLMRVVTFYSTLPQAAEATYLAGVVNRDLGNRIAARAAFTRVLDSYKDRTEEIYRKVVAEAGKEIDKLEAGGPAAKTPSGGGKKPPQNETGAGDPSPD